MVELRSQPVEAEDESSLLSAYSVYTHSRLCTVATLLTDKNETNERLRAVCGISTEVRALSAVLQPEDVAYFRVIRVTTLAPYSLLLVKRDQRMTAGVMQKASCRRSSRLISFYSASALLAMQSAVLARGILSVCLSVRPSVMFRYCQCRINHVADVANATGLRPQGGLRKSRKFFSARQ